MVKEYIDKYEKRPSKHDKNNNIRSLGKWITDQLYNYKKDLQIMKNKEIRIIFKKLLDDYKKYFKTDHEIWNEKYNKLIEFIIKYNKRPNTMSKDIDEKTLGIWLSRQIQLYKNNMLKDDIKYNKWTEIIKKYGLYLKANDDKWNEAFNKVILFFETMKLIKENL